MMDKERSVMTEDDAGIISNTRINKSINFITLNGERSVVHDVEGEKAQWISRRP